VCWSLVVSRPAGLLERWVPSHPSFLRRQKQPVGFACESEISFLFVGKSATHHSAKECICDALRIVRGPDFTNLLDPPLLLLAALHFDAAVSTYYFLLPHLSQGGSEVSHHPTWRRPDQVTNPGPMAKKMVEREEHIDSLETMLSAFRVVKEVEAVSECILNDGIACVRLEHGVHLYRLTSHVRPLHSAQHFVRMFSDGGLQFPNTGY